MKLAFISDIHGNAQALESVLQDITAKNVDQIYVLGDLCYRGPEPKRSIDLIRSLNATVIKGNADEWVVRGIRNGEVSDKVLELMNQERDWTHSQLDPSDIDYLANLPMDIHMKANELPSIYAFHATPQSLFEVIPPNAEDSLLEEKLMSTADASIYIYAHIHKPYIRYIGGKVIINIGSVGLPFDGLPKASYALVELDRDNIRTSIERVSFDVQKVIDLYKAVDYPNAEMMTRILTYARV